MPHRMIPVRNRHSGQETTVSERAYGYFAADFERLDQAAAEPEQAPASVSAAPAADPTPAPRRAAAKNDKE